MMGRMPAAKQIRIPDVQRYLTWRRLLKRHPYGIMTPAEAGRLLGLSGQEEEALAAYRRAVTLLKPIRYEYSVGYQNRHHSYYPDLYM